MMKNKMNLIRLAVFVISLIAAFPLYMAGKYFYYVSQFTESLEREEPIAAREHLQEIQYYYNWAKRIPFGEYLADNYIFDEAWYFEHSYNYIIGDYETVVNNLDGKQDYRAQHLVANSLFQDARKKYQSTDDEEQKNALITKTVEEINPYYERSLKMMPEDVSKLEKFKDQRNFDITSNPQSAAAALGNQEKIPVYILGVPGGSDEEGLELEGKGEEGDGNLFDTTVPEEDDPPGKKKG